MTDDPWTMERLRRMTRQEFWDCRRRGDLPPLELAARLLSERLGQSRSTDPDAGQQEGRAGGASKRPRAIPAVDRCRVWDD